MGRASDFLYFYIKKYIGTQGIDINLCALTPGSLC